MSTKHLRRVLEERETDTAREEKYSSEEEVAKYTPKFNKFTFFEDNGEEVDAKDSDHETVPLKKKTNKKRTDKKKKKKKQEKQTEAEDEDALLDKLARAGEMTISEGDETGEALKIEELFKADPKLFDPSVELKKVLGKSLKEKSDQDNSHHRHKAGLGRIARTKKNWPPVRSIGLSMEIDRSESNSVKWFKFTHNAHYEKCERLCWMAEDSYNHELINEVLHNAFYHLNGLLLLSNVYRMQEDMTQCCDCIERGIYYCEQSFHPLYQVFSWQHRLDYAIYENRAMYLLLHRHMLNIVQKRCFKTALNVAKLIFGLDPQGDPLGILLLIDTIAIKANEYGWLKNMYAAVKVWKNLDLLPNFLYSMAMVEHLEGNEIEADQLLSSAIVAHPGVVTEILNQLQIQADAEVESNVYLKTTAHARETEGLQMLVKIYVSQSAELWKAPATLSWLEKVTRDTLRDRALQTEMETWKEKRQRVFVGSPPNMRRLAMQLGLEQIGSSVTNPVPPLNGKQRYTREVPPEQHADGFLSGFLHSLYPDFNTTEHLSDAVRRMLADLLGGGGGDDGGEDHPAAPPQ